MLHHGDVKYKTLIKKKMLGTFYEKELQTTKQREFKVEKVIKRKGNKL